MCFIMYYDTYCVQNKQPRPGIRMSAINDRLHSPYFNRMSLGCRNTNGHGAVEVWIWTSNFVGISPF